MRDWLIIFGAMVLCGLLIFSCGKKEDSKAVPLGYAILTGRVTEADSTTPIAGAKVYEKDHKQGSATSDSAGYFMIDNVAFEAHTLYVEKDGYVPATIEFEYKGKLDHPLVTKLARMTKK